MPINYATDYTPPIIREISDVVAGSLFPKHRRQLINNRYNIVTINCFERNTKQPNKFIDLCKVVNGNYIYIGTYIKIVK